MFTRETFVPLYGVCRVRYANMWDENFRPKKLGRGPSRLFIVVDCRWRQEKVAHKSEKCGVEWHDRGVSWDVSSIPLGPEFFCRRLSDQHYYRGEVGERKEKSENMPVQNYNEDLTELMKKTPTMSWVLEGDKGRHVTAYTWIFICIKHQLPTSAFVSVNLNIAWAPEGIKSFTKLHKWVCSGLIGSYDAGIILGLVSCCAEAKALENFH